MGSRGGDRARTCTFWSVLNVTLCASDAQHGLDIFVQIFGDFSKMVENPQMLCSHDTGTSGIGNEGAGSGVIHV